MDCKDSQVFALESYIEEILNQGGWKEPKEIATALHKVKGINQIQLKTMVEFSEELFVENLMDRLCNLFPMKYEKSPHKSLYQRTFSVSNS
ncbi:MAG: hypothetical protein GX238_01235 [Epulopiscium sp.]|nr:hypothetical protein [Candidatus Epulonipiscium sp.]